MSSLTDCPSCNANWIGKEIPEKNREFFGYHTHFKLEISIYSPIQDCTIAWGCPVCRACFDVHTMQPTGDKF